MKQEKKQTENSVLEKLSSIENLLKKKNDHAFRQTSKPLSFREAADYLGFRPSYLYKLTHRKLIPFFKPSGKMLFFAKSDLDEWVFGKEKVKSEKLKEGEVSELPEGESENEDEEPP